MRGEKKERKSNRTDLNIHCLETDNYTKENEIANYHNTHFVLIEHSVLYQLIDSDLYSLFLDQL